MVEHDKVFSRREVLELAVAAGGLTLSGEASSMFGQPMAAPIFTPSIILGPFYPQIKPSDQDSDLTIVSGKQQRAEGTVVYVSGRVTNIKGEPVRGAKVSVWQANTHGRYAHKSDMNPAPVDPNFQGFGSLVTDAEGRYRFKTIKPGAYPAPVVGMRAPHVHFEVEARYDRLITQMFFPNEPLNEQDHFLQFVKGPYRDAVIAEGVGASDAVEPGALSFKWNIILLSG